MQARAPMLALLAAACAFDSTGTGLSDDGGTATVADATDSTGAGTQEVCNGVDDDDDGAIDEYSAQNSRCNDCRYRLVSGGTEVLSMCTNPLPWPLAAAYCATLGGDLASIHSSEDNAAVDAMSTDRAAWIGFTDVVSEGVWYWVDGSQTDFTAWADGEPNNTNGAEHCAAMRTEDPSWNDLPCDSAEAFVCRAPL